MEAANYTKRFYGPSIMRLGIEKSRNLMTAETGNEFGYGHSAGICPAVWSE